MSFVKLDSNILDSSLWLESSDTVKVFLTMLAMADADGFVAATAPGIAKRAALSLAVARDALKALESPDPDSRSSADEGRRARRIEGGYLLTNYLKYRKKDHSAAERMRRLRAQRRAENVTTVRPRSANVTQAEAEAEAEADPKQERNSHSIEGKFYRPNDLVTGRHQELRDECLRRVREVAKQRGCDGEEVMREASVYKGRAVLNPDNMSDDRLLQTVLKLREMADPKRAQLNERNRGSLGALERFVQRGHDARAAVDAIAEGEDDDGA